MTVICQKNIHVYFIVEDDFYVLIRNSACTNNALKSSTDVAIVTHNNSRCGRQML